MATVLVIEKEELVRTFLQRALQDGHAVSTSDTVQAAARDFSGQSFDVVIVDGSAGTAHDMRQLAREARTRWHCAVIVTSGGSTLPDRLVEYDSFVLLSKPFRAADLIAGIRIARSRERT